MPRIFLSNFYFEHVLSDARFRPTQKLLEISAKNSLTWLKLAARGDVIALPDVPVSRDIAAAIQRGKSGVEAVLSADLPGGPDWQAVPWGWTDSVRKLATQQGWSFTEFHFDSVRQLNSRCFAFEREAESGLQPGPSGMVRTWEELEAFLETHREERGWLLKGEFGMSGRERLKLTERALNESQIGWLRNEFSAGRAIVVEPYLERIEEVSVHYEIHEHGEMTRCGIAALTSDLRGQFLRAEIGTEAEQCQRLNGWEKILPWTDRAARMASLAGYVGPLGIDAMRYKDREHGIAVRPLQDVNARWTMGRLALEESRRSIRD